jgi:hypothetical protein
MIVCFHLLRKATHAPVGTPRAIPRLRSAARGPATSSGSAVSIASTVSGTLLGQNQKISLTGAVEKNAVGTTNTQTVCGIGL